MKSLTKLWQYAALDCAAMCSIRIERDYQTVLARVKHEGLSFLTMTLPSFCSDFELALDRGYVGSDLFHGFKWTGGLPAFLSGFLSLVFDKSSGLLQPSASVEAIASVRQLCLLFKKIEMECTPRRKAAAITAYEECEDDLRRVSEKLTPADLQLLAKQAWIVFGDVFDALNKDVESFELSPRHGPGETADKLRANAKFSQKEWTQRMETIFPFSHYVLPRVGVLSDWPVSHLSPEQEHPAKVVLVPKTQKTPRVIAEEPTALQYMQQALKCRLVPLLEQDPLCGPLVGFTHQEPNRQLARRGSLGEGIATLDLSEASDRVLNSAVLAILSPWPSLSEAVQACRSQEALLPNGKKLPLVKFASMGSALCFPMEEIVFLSVILLGMNHGKPLTRPEVFNLHGRVRVYGDDIIIPVDRVEDCVKSLEAYGLKVNHTKSFWNGKFRESCGGDFYDGEWVTPVRVKSLFPQSRRDGASIVSTMELCNRLYENGYWKASRFVLDVLQSIGIGHTVVPYGTVAVAPITFQEPTRNYVFDKDLHHWKVRVHVVHAKAPSSVLDGLPALMKCFSGDYSAPENEGHLSRAGRPRSTHVKRGWARVELRA